MFNIQVTFSVKFAKHKIKNLQKQKLNWKIYKPQVLVGFDRMHLVFFGE